MSEKINGVVKDDDVLKGKVIAELLENDPEDSKDIIEKNKKEYKDGSKDV